MQKNIPYLKFYVSDFYADSAVMGMTVEELGSYLNLLFICWREGSIPRDLKELTELNRGVTPTDRVIKKFSVKRGNSRRLVQKRLEKERFAYAEICKRRREAAYKGGQATKIKHLNKGHLASHLGAQLELESEPEPKPEKPSTYKQFSQDHARSPIHANGDQREFPGFSLFWQAYPIQEAKIKARFQWITNGLEVHTAAVLESLEKWKLCERWKDPQYIPQACRWIAERRWTEQPFTRPKTKSLVQQLTELETKMELERKTEHDRSRKPPEPH